jgi:putative 4-hydroxybenzoate polyprenyltransferase
VSATPGPVREGQTYAGATRFSTYASFVKLPHTVFAMPFAMIGVIFASYTRAVTWATLGWTIVAFTSARFAAMGFNRIVDREFDAKNPRTSMREIPRGALSVREASIAVVVASALFITAAGALNPLCLLLSPIALGWVFFYSYTKRFTRFAHIVLGIGMSIAPVGGYLAVTGQWSRPWWLLCLLATTVITWGAGFDVLYALPDIAFDKANGLHSIPVAFGERGAIGIARALHIVTVSCLVLIGLTALPSGRAELAGTLYWVGVAVAAALLAYEHSLVRPGDLSKLNAAFFTMNGVISLTLLTFVLAGRLLANVSFDLSVHVR